MIGQTMLLRTLQGLVDRKQLFRLIILVGGRGSGKTCVAEEIAKMLGAYLVPVEKGVDAVREAVENCYKCTRPTVYLFQRSERMSAQAKNALLKITEEPPRLAYFILEVEDLQNIPDTLRSRGTAFFMSIYARHELENFTKDPNILKIALNPGQVKELESIDVAEFIDFCDSVLDNIGKVTGVNAFKICQKLKFKEDAEGYDPELFLSSIASLASARVVTVPNGYVTHMKYVQTISCCLKYCSELRINGIKKDATLDMWVLEMRDIWA